MPLYQLNGVQIRFPFDAYDCQLVYMEKVIAAVQKRQNALLESPTGTGKTLCLLCASLAWRESLQSNRKQDCSSQGAKLPTIIYASRTHSQLRQVIGELQATSYRPKMVVLGSREQMCINSDVQRLQGRAQNHACRSLRKTRSCVHYNRVDDYLKSHPELGNEPIDIEDLVRIGRSQGPCPYFVSRELHNSAEIIFLPYNYLIEKENRKSLSGIRWDDAVIIFDEAHNLEGVCADAASFDLSSSLLTACISEASRCIELASVQRSSNNAADKSVDPENFAVLKALILELEKRINDLPVESEEVGFTKPGAFIYEFLSGLKITSETVTMLTDTIDYAVNLLQDESSVGRQKGTTCKLEYLRDALRIVFPGSGSSHASFYRVHVQDKKTAKGDRNGRTFSWWCFNPGIAMAEFARMGVRSVLLTSGTLSPLESFAMELKLKFDVRLENPHVVGPAQIWVGVVSSGPSGKPLNSSFRTRDSLEYKNELGNTIVNFSRIVPDGLLVFFPSYYLLTSCIEAWHTPNQVASSTVWERICRHKQPVIEPKESALFGHAHQDFLEKLKDPTSAGAVFFAVCRGKVSEGLDFADQSGRAVIVTGIPYAMKTDPKVRLKRSYLDEQRKSAAGKALSGDEWYVQQAGRAVNQAVGRVIRHKDDYGAIILCDERFAHASAQNQLSLWLRPHLKSYNRFGDVSYTLTRFFKEKRPNSLVKPTTRKDNSTQPKLSSSMEIFSSKRTALSSFQACTVGEDLLQKRTKAGSFGRTTTEASASAFGAKQQQEGPLSAFLAAKRDLSSVSSITPANQAIGVGAVSNGCTNSKRLKPLPEAGPKCRASSSSGNKMAAEYLAMVKAQLSELEYRTFVRSVKSLKDELRLDRVPESISKLFAAPERQPLLERFGTFLRSQPKASE